MNPESDKTLILISSAIVWSGTRGTGAPFEDKDFTQRIAPLAKQELKLLENDVLAACRTSNGTEHAVVHPHKRSYVLCAGLVYGCGEEYEPAFEKLFMRAWNGGSTEDEGLFIMNEGNNVVPTVHIKDLAKMVGKLIVARPDPHEHPYFLAVDKAGAGQTQEAIVESIGKKIGVDKIYRTKYFALLTEELKETMYPLTANVQMKSSALLELGKEEWHCENGFVASIDKVFEELKVCKGLRGVKVLLTGPPAAGKTRFAEW